MPNGISNRRYFLVSVQKLLLHFLHNPYVIKIGSFGLKDVRELKYVEHVEYHYPVVLCWICFFSTFKFASFCDDYIVMEDLNYISCLLLINSYSFNFKLTGKASC